MSVPNGAVICQMHGYVIPCPVCDAVTKSWQITKSPLTVEGLLAETASLRAQLIEAQTKANRLEAILKEAAARLDVANTLSEATLNQARELRNSIEAFRSAGDA